ncbi:hypothetical protein CICLE_v10006395mg [Citrus x clementina]|uniref:Uncharacterized protein n=2 Tax=Citrus TaxID=2706 RepID=A0A067D5Q9_CITSI|nr:hypothetical protein CICLE_v10006395mg [Citrus x clementina]KDO36865.1 hypothetical protein CISIN_1g048711mg [Citrus sinensis]
MKIKIKIILMCLQYLRAIIHTNTLQQFRIHYIKTLVRHKNIAILFVIGCRNTIIPFIIVILLRILS